MLLNYCVECGKHRNDTKSIIIPAVVCLLPFKALMCDSCLIVQAESIKPHFSFTLSDPIVPKSRPRVTKRVTYYPKRYTDWRKAASAEIDEQLSAVIYSHIADIKIWTAADRLNVKKKEELLLPFDRNYPVAIFVDFYGSLRGNSDNDNAIGAILDVLVRDKDGWCLSEDTVQRVPFIQARFHKLPKKTKKNPQHPRTVVEVYPLIDAITPEIKTKIPLDIKC